MIELVLYVTDFPSFCQVKFSMWLFSQTAHPRARLLKISGIFLFPQAI